MQRILPLLLLFFCCTVWTHAQKKSDLLAQIEDLRTELDSVKSMVATAQRNERASATKSEALQAQVSELQDANATLLKNLNSFATVSSKNSENIGKAMESLRAKEAELKVIKEALAANDSTALVVLTNIKQSLGEDAKVAVSQDGLVISESLETLFGSASTTTPTPESVSWLEKIANILKGNPSMNLTVEGLSMTGELVLAAQQARALEGVLTEQFAIDPSRIRALGKDGNLKEGIALKLHPKFDEFYRMVKEHMKNGN